MHEVRVSQSEKIDEDLLFKENSDGSKSQKSPKKCALRGFDINLLRLCLLLLLKYRISFNWV